jgi:hypothetical protein
VDRREIDGVADGAVAQEVADRGGRVEPHLLLGLLGRGGDVRRGHDLPHLHERPVGRRLLLEDVERRARDDALVDRAPERQLVDELAASRVDDADARLHARKAFVIQQSPRVGGRGQVQGQEVGLLAHGIERQQLDPGAGRHVGGDERVVGDDPHAERAGPLGHFLADPSESHDPEGLAVELGAEKAFLLPPAFFHGVVGGRHGPSQGEHERARVLGHADAVRARRVDDEDAPSACGGHVDVVDARARAADDPQARGGGEQVGGDLRGAPDEQRIGVRKGRLQVRQRPAAAGVDHPSRFAAQQIERRRRQVVGDDDPDRVRLMMFRT